MARLSIYRELWNNTIEHEEMQYKQTKHNKPSQKVSNRTGFFSQSYLTVSPNLSLAVGIFWEKLMFGPKRCSRDVMDAKRLDRQLMGELVHQRVLLLFPDVKTCYVIANNMTIFVSGFY